MLLRDEVEMLRRVPIFSRIAPAKLKLLAFTSDRMTYKAGQNLFLQGDVGDAAYVILSG
ncbi:cyclic nucleotide-binding protein, partial [Rhizobium ruizarguesonis]